VWIAAGAVGTGGVSVLAAAKLWKNKTHEREQGESHDNQ